MERVDIHKVVTVLGDAAAGYEQDDAWDTLRTLNREHSYAFRPLLDALKSSHRSVRAYAIDGLKRLDITGPESHDLVDRLAPLCRDRDRGNAASAVSLISRYAGESTRARDALHTVVKDMNASLWPRLFAFFVLLRTRRRL
jgi:hypothetical protein